MKNEFTNKCLSILIILINSYQMEQVARFIENSKKRSELQSYAQLNVEQLQTVHLAKLKDNFTNLAGDIKQSRETIDKNLGSITSYKHNIRKAGETVNEVGLELSNNHHEKFVDFVAKAMTFANIVGEDTNLDATNQDEFDLTAATQIRNENMMQEIRKQKNLIEVVETVAQCMSMLRENVEVEDNSFFEEKGSLF